MPSRDTQRFFLPLLERHVALTPGARVLEMGYYDPAAALWAAGNPPAGAGAAVVALRPAIDLVAELVERARAAGLDTLDARLAGSPANQGGGAGLRGAEPPKGVGLGALAAANPLASLAPDEVGSFDAALLLAPFFLGNAPVRDALRLCAAALRPEGALYVQLHRRHGGDTYLREAEALFDRLDLLGMGGGQRRLYRASGPRREAAQAALSAPAVGAAHELDAGGATLRLRLAAGVFSAQGIDAGSRLLLDTVETPAGASILDLGCGAGVLGLALAARDPGARVVLVDSVGAAVELSRENAVANGLQNVEVRLGDGYSAVGECRFDCIVSNLPAHRGHKGDLGTPERFIAGAPAHLAEGGVAWFVANRALPYELPAARAFREVRLAGANARFKVLRCSQPRTLASGQTAGEARPGRPARQARQARSTSDDSRSVTMRRTGRA